jgi:hypothetical protein
MLHLNGTKVPASTINDIGWVRDLIHFDGPLLSEFRHRLTGAIFLYYWCDCDALANRWMVCRISEASLQRLVLRIVSLDQIIPQGGEDVFVYFVDMNERGEPLSVVTVPINEIPVQYTPATGVFFDAGSESPTTPLRNGTTSNSRNPLPAQSHEPVG